MALDVGGKYFRFRAGGTTYSYFAYTSAQGGTKYLAFRRGGVTRYLPFTTGGTEKLRINRSGTTYALVAPQCVVNTTFIVIVSKLFGGGFKITCNNDSRTGALPSASTTVNYRMTLILKATSNTGQEVTDSTAYIEAGATSSGIVSNLNDRVVGTNASSSVTISLTVTANGFSASSVIYSGGKVGKTTIPVTVVLK